MSKSMKVWFLTAAALILAGGILFGGVMTVLQWDFSKLSTIKFETHSYEDMEGFDSISVVTDTADVVFIPSEDGTCSVVCYEMEQANHSVSVKDGTLVIALEDSRKWYQYMELTFDHPVITISIPADAYSALSVSGKTGDVQLAGAFSFESVDISVSTGSICVENITTGSMALSVSTGKVKVSQVNCADEVRLTTSTGKTELQALKCKNLISTGGTGKLTMAHVFVEEKMQLKRDTGNISLEKCDAGTLDIETSTGNVSGTLLSPKVFLVQTDTGRVDVPQSMTGGRCQITTDTGNIEISIE